MQVQLRPLATLRRYENNPRRNDSAVAAVAASIQEFGWRQPIVVDEQGVIVVGDTRYQVALHLGLEQVPVHVATGLTPEQLRAYRLADNKTHELASWDNDRLAQELLELHRSDFAIDLLGFSADELQKLIALEPTVGQADPDAVPEPPDMPTTQPGDLWILGKHRLLCGDAGNAADVDRLLEGAAVHLVNTDPPYGVHVEPRSKNAIAAGLSSFSGTQPAKLGTQRRPGKTRPTRPKLRARDRALANDFVSEAEFERLLQAWFGNLARVLVPGRAFLCWGGYTNLANYPAVLKAHGLYFSQAIIWVKEHAVLTRKDFMGNFELGFYGWREGAAHVFLGPNNVSDVWSVKKVSPQQMVHLTEKPVELAQRAIQYLSRPGENVLDLFGGSGSTLIACEQNERRAYVMELDAPYCDVIVRRWEQFTGKTAQRSAAAKVSA